MMWGVGQSASSPDSGGVLELGYSKSIGQNNLAGFRNDRFDELYRKQSLMPDGPERARRDPRSRADLDRLHAATSCGSTASAPTSCSPGWWATSAIPNAHEFWKYVDIDTSRLPR